MAYTYEDMQGINDFIGPWTAEVELQDGSTRTFGYEPPSTLEYPDRWDVEYLGFQEDQQLQRSLDYRLIRALADEQNTIRKDRLRRILLWIARADKKFLKRNRRTFYLRVLESRKQCARTGLWYYVYLTKDQVDTVFGAFQYRFDNE
jgi:hypothetical protein